MNLFRLRRNADRRNPICQVVHTLQATAIPTRDDFYKRLTELLNNKRIRHFNIEFYSLNTVSGKIIDRPQTLTVDRVKAAEALNAFNTLYFPNT